ncbi:hypothetical protein NDU88_003323 [Pleurodeles waltl]|uniref:Uncharacterized protein n=1 Tax=Pleurodeles waltl TaxID=8319 RepID=A0AAV7P9K9_PLEWA|nr:hypothetical protein NDU88_003323 [Pleurodeles waltl]
MTGARTGSPRNTISRRRRRRGTSAPSLDRLVNIRPRYIFPMCGRSDLCGDGPVLPKGFLEMKAKLHAMNIRYMLMYPARLKGISVGKSQFFDHPEEVWRLLGCGTRLARVVLGGLELARLCTSGVDGTDWRKWGDGPLQVAAQRCDNSVSRIEIQQDGIMAVVDPEQAVELADSSDGEAEMLSVDS